MTINSVLSSFVIIEEQKRKKRKYVLMFLCQKKNNPHHQQPLKRAHKQKESVPSKRTHPQSLWLLQIKSAFYYLRLTNPKKGLILLAFLSMGVLPQSP